MTGVQTCALPIYKKVRDAEIQKIPIILIVGPKDKDNNEVSIRTHEQGEIKVKLTELKSFISNFSYKFE